MLINGGESSGATIKPVEDWRLILRHAWSVRFMVIAAVLSGAEVTISVMMAYGVRVPYVPPGTAAGLAGLVTVAAFVSRFVAQQKLGAK